MVYASGQVFYPNFSFDYKATVSSHCDDGKGCDLFLVDYVFLSRQTHIRSPEGLDVKKLGKPFIHPPFLFLS